MNCFIVVDLVKDPILQRSLTRSTTRVSQRPTYLLLLACIIQFVLISSESRADSSIKAFVTKHCVDCHGAEQPEAGVDLNGPYDDRALLENRDVWLRALQQLEVGAMPPDEPLPKSTELAAFKQTLLSKVRDVDWEKFHDPGRLSLSRLTAVEYRHAIRDIFGVDFHAGGLLGKDPEGGTGFTNDRDALTFPLYAMNDFLSEAERIAEAYLNYRRDRWKAAIEFEDAWKASSDKSTVLNDAGTAAILKDRNAPFQLNLVVPFSGMYQVDMDARVEWILLKIP